VSAVVVHYRTPERLCECLGALSRQRGVELDVLVVDNSGPLDAAPQPDEGSGWRLHRAAENVGYGRACNTGAALTTREHLLFLNADLTLSEDACAQLCAVAAANATTAVVGPRIYAADGEIELSARSFPSVRTGILGRSSLLTRLLRRAAREPAGLSAALGERAVAADWVSGACMLIRREPFEHVGGFDEGYWMYWEDADICRRLREHGWLTMFCPSAVARHITGSSGQSRQTIEAFHTSAARYYALHAAHGPLAATLAGLLLKIRKTIMLGRHALRAAR
jgi:GT2 family glycosyltransferase